MLHTSRMQPAPEPMPEPESEPAPCGHPSTSAADGNKICGRWATLTGLVSGDPSASVRYAEGTSYDNVVLGAGANYVEHNSVLLIPGLLREEECAQLIEDVEVCGVVGRQAGADGLERHRVLAEPRLSAGTAALFEDLLRERLLPLISSEMPSVADYLWSCSLAAEHDPSFAAVARTPGVALKALPYRCPTGRSEMMTATRHHPIARVSPPAC